jgi:sec-independent protein translocase protein TatC
VPLSANRTRHPPATAIFRVGLMVAALIASTIMGLVLAREILPTLYLATCSFSCRQAIVDPTEGILSWLRFAFMVGLPFSLPFILDQALHLLAPRQRRTDDRSVLIALAAIPGFFLVGAVGGAVVAARVLYGLLPLPGLDIPGLPQARFFQLVVGAGAWFGLAGMIPLLMILAARFRLIDWRRLPVLLPAVVAAARTVAGWIVPPSATTAVVLVMALLIAIFGLGVLGARLATSTRPRAG